jgi:HSP20 family molecular chaperone IbpA
MEDQDMTGKNSSAKTPIRISSKLSKSFQALEDSIRERAYQLFLNREVESDDSMGDWLRAQEELLTPVALDIKEQKTSVVAQCDLSGFSAEEIEVEVDEGVLKVFGKHLESSTAKEQGRETTTSTSAHFFQSAPLPCPVKADKATVKLFKNGKLKVTLPKA